MNKATYLAELKAHDWTYNYSSGQSYYKGRDNEARLLAITMQHSELKSLYEAYADFIFNGSKEPTVQPTNTTTRSVMNDAWKISRRAAKRYGHPVKSFIAQAMREAWAKIKIVLKAANKPLDPKNLPVTIYTVCIDERLTNRITIINQLAVEVYFTDLNDACFARDMLAAVFKRPFIKAGKSCFA